MTEIGEKLANAAIIEIARQCSGSIGNTGDDDVSDIAFEDECSVIGLSRSELGNALAVVITDERARILKVAAGLLDTPRFNALVQRLDAQDWPQPKIYGET